MQNILEKKNNFTKNRVTKEFRFNENELKLLMLDIMSSKLNDYFDKYMENIFILKRRTM